MIEVPASDWKFGYNAKGENKTRIIITTKDAKNNEYVRIYDKEPLNRTDTPSEEDSTDQSIAYFCVKCLSDKKLKNVGKLINGEIFHAQTFHFCEKLCAKKNEEEQKELRKMFMKNHKPSRSSSPIVLSSDKPAESKPLASDVKRRTPNFSQSLSSVVVDLTSASRSQHSNSTGKNMITNHFKSTRRNQSEDSSPENNRRKSLQRKLPSQKRQSLKNKSNEPKNEDQKSASVEDEIIILEPEEHNSDFEPNDFDDHPESFNTNQFPLQRGSPKATDHPKEESVEARNEEVKVSPMYENERVNFVSSKQSVAASCFSLDAKSDAEKNVIEQITNALKNKMEIHRIKLNDCEPQKTGGSTANINSEHDSSNTSYIPSTSISSPNESSNEFRKVDCDYASYELNENREIKKRLIVKEANLKFASEYTVTGNEEVFKCLNCEIGIARKVVDGYLVSIKHECAPILYETIETTQNECNTKNVALSLKILSKSLKEIQEQQSSYIKGRKRPKKENATVVESKRIRRSGTINGQEIDLEVGEESKRPRRSATKNRQNNQNASNLVDASPMNDSNNEGASGYRLDTPESYTPSSSITGRATNVQNEPMEDVLDSNKLVKKIDPTTFKFYLPSSSDFEKYCKMLQLDDFSHEAYKFWANEIDIKNIRPSSIPNKLYSLTSSEKTGYASLTFFLTGSETQTSAIKQTFERIYFFINMADIGNKYYGENLSQTYDSKTIGILLAKDLTKYHLQGFCQFFECRIGVFVDEKWERYGNWDNENANVLTILMKKEGEKFCPILSLKQ